MRQVDHDIERIRPAAGGVAGKGQQAVRVTVIDRREVAPDIGGERGRYCRYRRRGLAQINLHVDSWRRKWIGAAIAAETNRRDLSRLTELGVRVNLLVAHAQHGRPDGTVEGET